VIEAKGEIKAGDWKRTAQDLVAPSQQRAISPPLPKRQSRSNASKAPSALALPQADPRPADPTGAAAAKGAARNDEAAAIGASSLGGLRLRPRCGVAAVSFM